MIDCAHALKLTWGKKPVKTIERVMGKNSVFHV